MCFVVPLLALCGKILVEDDPFFFTIVHSRTVRNDENALIQSLSTLDGSILNILIESGLLNELAEDSEAGIVAGSPKKQRLLRACVAMGVVEEEEEGRFVLTPKGRSLTRIKHWMLLQEEMHQFFLEGLRAEFSDLPSTRAFYTHLQNNVEISRIFNEAMRELTELQLPALLSFSQSFLSNCDVLCDIGGGTGQLILEILKAGVIQKGIVFDVSSTAVEEATEVFAKEKVNGGAVQYDAFRKGEENAECGCVVMKGVTSDYNDTELADLLEVTLHNFCVGGVCPQLFLVDHFLETSDSRVLEGFKHRMDVMMMSLFSGARQRTFSELVSMAASMGLSASLHDIGSTVSVVEMRSRK